MIDNQLKVGQVPLQAEIYKLKQYEIDLKQLTKKDLTVNSKAKLDDLVKRAELSIGKKAEEELKAQQALKDEAAKKNKEDAKQVHEIAKQLTPDQIEFDNLNNQFNISGRLNQPDVEKYVDLASKLQINKPRVTAMSDWLKTNPLKTDKFDQVGV